MKTFSEWLEADRETKFFKDIKEARDWLGRVARGHGIVNCSCGDRIESCRCLAKDHHIAIVEGGCEKCGGDPHPEMRKVREEIASLENIHAIAAKANLDISRYDKKEIKAGMDEELEHGKKNKKLNVTNDDPVKTLKIVLAHLQEDPHYYRKLKSVM